MILVCWKWIWDGLGLCHCSVPWLPQRLMSVSPVAHTFHPEKLSELVWLCLQQYTFGDPHQPDCKYTPHHSRQWLAESCTHFVVVVVVFLPVSVIFTVQCNVIAKCQYSYTRHVVWCQEHTFTENRKTSLNYNGKCQTSG